MKIRIQGSVQQDASIPTKSQAVLVEADVNTVWSVNGQAGAVQLDAAAVGADPSGAAATVQDAIMSSTARSGLGTYIPPGWGERWRTARNNAATGGKARIVAVGDSITHGFFASSLFTTSWVGRTRNMLQAQYGDGGLGYFTSMNSTMAGHGTAINTAWTAAGCFVTSTGTWTADTSSAMGPGIYSVDSTTSGSTLTFPARGSTVKIYTITGGASRAGYRYSIDGSAAVTVADSGGGGAAAIQVTTVSGLTPASHSVTITWNGTAGQKLSVCGVGSENDTGIVVSNVARSGARASGYSVNTPSALNAVWNGGTEYPGDLVIYALGLNDAAANVTGDAWAASVTKHLQAVRSVTDGSTDILIVMNHVGTLEGTNTKWQDYVQRARGLADTYNAALVDLWAIGRNSWNYWDQQGYWGDVANPGAAGHDTAHLSDAGHQRIADAILPVLTS